jgi:hypothetical protein
MQGTGRNSPGFGVCSAFAERFLFADGSAPAAS